MRAWWTGMAAFGSPPALDMLNWPIYDGVGNVGMQLDTPARAGRGLEGRSL